MTEPLPITITVHSELAEQFFKINSVCNKLEAQFNFHTLTANWYGDEENILLINLAVETPESFAHFQADSDNFLASGLEVEQFSDDVMSCVNSIEQQINCYIAITNTEQALLAQQPKLLAGYMQAKLRKVLNLIAEQQSLTSI